MLFRPLLPAAVGVVLFALTGCAGGEESSEAAPPPGAGSALAGVDPCTIMKPDQLAAEGLPPQGGKVEQIDSEPGCTFRGDVAGIAFYRNATKTLEDYGKQDNWSEFTKIDVNGRQAARAKNEGATDDMCTTVLSAGGGVVLVDAQASDPRKPFDGCAESLKIAQMIEPNLPK